MPKYAVDTNSPFLLSALFDFETHVKEVFVGN
jgi:hypothetical protein